MAFQKLKFKKFDEFQVGDKEHLFYTIEQKDVDLFASFTGDYNPLHVDPEYASTTDFNQPVVHGMLNACHISTLIGMKLPGPGALWTSQTIEFIAPAFVGDNVEIEGEIRHISKGTNTLTISIRVTNQRGQDLIKGDAVVKFLKKKEVNMPINKIGPKNYLVIGGSGGVGRFLIDALIKDGCNVYYTYNRSKPSIDDSDNCISIRCDLNSETEISNLLDKLKSVVLDGVVHLASSSPKIIPVLNSTWSDFEDQIAINVKSIHQIIPGLINNEAISLGGSVVVVSTVFTQGRPPTNQAPYITAKYALNGYTKALAAELGPKGIRFNIVAPGMIFTNMISHVPEKTKMVTKMNTPLRKLAEPGEIVGVINFLLSTSSSHMTGAVLNVSAGYEM